MKIALFTETYLPYINGVVTHVKILRDGLLALGHEVLVVCANPDTNKYYIEDGVLNCPAVSFKKFYDYGLASPFSLPRLKHLKEFDPDIIHIHNEFGVGYSGAMTAKNLDIPLVYTLHTMYDDYLYYIAPKIASKPFINIAKKTSHKYAKFLAQKATSLTGPSKKVEEYFREIGVDKPVHIIPNPVEIDIFTPDCIDNQSKLKIRKQFGAKDDYLLACFCGRLGKEKSVDVMLKYWAKTVKPDDKIKLLIIGGGPCKEDLEKYAQELGISNMVTFVGKIEHNKLPPYYVACDIYITTSLSDTNSISMLEGMAAGLPVLHIYDELNTGQVKHGFNGFVFKDQNEMYEQLISYKNKTPEQRAVFKKNARKSVKSAGAETLAKNLLEVYDISIKNYKKRKSQ